MPGCRPLDNVPFLLSPNFIQLLDLHDAAGLSPCGRKGQHPGVGTGQCVVRKTD